MSNAKSLCYREDGTHRHPYFSDPAEDPYYCTTCARIGTRGGCYTDCPCGCLGFDESLGPCGEWDEDPGQP